MATSDNPMLHYLDCSNCGRRFGLLTGTGKLLPDGLPDPFHAKCPHCETGFEYAKSSIQLLALDKSKNIEGG
jgi:DNA-directed RNA polymerase subunit RPC12/RpoP